MTLSIYYPFKTTLSIYYTTNKFNRKKLPIGKRQANKHTNIQTYKNQYEEFKT